MPGLHEDDSADTLAPHGRAPAGGPSGRIERQTMVRSAPLRCARPRASESAATVTVWAAGACTALLACATLHGCAPTDPEVQLHDIRRWEDARTLPADSLAILLRRANPMIRSAAARAIGRIGDPRGVEALAQALGDDPRAVVRAEAAFALGILGAPEATPALVRAATGEPEARTLGEIALALGRLQQPGTTEVLTHLLQSGHPFVREQAAEALALVADTTSVGGLLAATQDSFESVAWRAVYALEKVPTPASIPRLTAMADAPSPLIRAYVARTLGRIADERGAPVAAHILERARSDWHVRANAALALGRIGGERAIRALQSALGDSIFHVRAAALAGLEQASSKAAAPRVTAATAGAAAAAGAAGAAAASAAPIPAALAAAIAGAAAAVERACADSVVDVRAAAYSALAECEHAGAYSWLLRGIGDPAPHVAAICMEALGRCGDPRARTVLSAALADTTLPRQRVAAASGLGHTGDGEAAGPALRACVDARDWVLAATAIEALGLLGDKQCVPQLLRAFAERQGTGRLDVRWQVVQTLEALKDPAAVPLLRSALDDDDVRVRVVARKALAAILPEVEAAGLPTEQKLRRDVRPARRSPSQPALVIHTRARQLVLETARGRIRIELLPEEAPQTVESFARLAERGFFNGRTFHRVVPNFVIQGGDPLGNGWGDAGYSLRCEWSPQRYDAGTVGVAHSGKDTGGCQLFITHSPQPHLDARYTVIGRVVEGMRVVDAVRIGDRFTASVVWEDATP